MMITSQKPVLGPQRKIPYKKSQKTPSEKTGWVKGGPGLSMAKQVLQLEF